MPELTDDQIKGILDSLAELAAQVVGIKNTLKEDQTTAIGHLNHHIEEARKKVRAGWPSALPDLAERLKRS